jgi:peptidoglycan/xylan/chitin deacetylase (PgdA/CDA1 family)
MAGRRLQLARLLYSTGLYDLLSPKPRASLFVVNYHRIWPDGTLKTEFDDGVFDVDVETFRSQMKWLRNATQVLDENGLAELRSRESVPAGAVYSLVTFDDGYIDCFRLVKPILDDLGIRGIFFIPIAILANRCLGWWDLAAYLMKHSALPRMQLRGQTFELGPRVSQSLRRVLNLFKLESADKTKDLLAELAEASGVQMPGKDRQSAELMDWTHVRDLRATGHGIGSHAWSHRVLATLGEEEQASEIRESRRELQAILGQSVVSFAYPVGGLQHFNEASVRLVRESGYEQAFTFNTGMSTLPVHDQFRIPRESAKSLELLKAKVRMPGLMGLKARRAVGE